jgi:hypothetical protein
MWCIWKWGICQTNSIFLVATISGPGIMIRDSEHPMLIDRSQDFHAFFSSTKLLQFMLLKSFFFEIQPNLFMRFNKTQKDQARTKSYFWTFDFIKSIIVVYSKIQTIIGKLRKINQINSAMSIWMVYSSLNQNFAFFPPFLCVLFFIFLSSWE